MDLTDYNFLQAYTLKNGVKLKNRVVMLPMTIAASFANGIITNDEIDYYKTRTGGVGMLITAVANINDLGKGFEGQLSIATDDMIPRLKLLANAIKQDGTKAVIQIFSAGRQANSRLLRGQQPVSASAVAAEFPPNSEMPRELTAEEVEQTVKDFGEATRRAIEAGFDGVELHGANTYLIQQFFSPHSNRREDHWGGSRDGRMTFALEVIQAAKAAIGQYADEPFILGYRLSPEEVETPGIRLEDSLYLTEKIKDDIDYLNISLGHYKQSSLNDKTNEATLISQFKQVLDDSATPLLAGGFVITPEDAQAAMNDGADLVGLGRQLIREPKWMQKVISGDKASIRYALSPNEYDELAIPGGTRDYLKTYFGDTMNYSVDLQGK